MTVAGGIGIFASKFTALIADGHERYRVPHARALLECMRNQLHRQVGTVDPRFQSLLTEGNDQPPAMLLVVDRNGDAEILPYDCAIKLLRERNTQALWPNSTQKV